VLVNWSDILDEELVSAAGAVVAMVAKPRPGRRAAAALDTAAWGDTERLIREALAEVAADTGLPDLSEDELTVLHGALKRHEVQGAVQALLAVRLTDATETDATRAREGVELALTEGIYAGTVPALRARLARLVADESATPPVRLNARRLAGLLAGPGSGLLEAGAERAAAAGLSGTDWLLLQQHVSALATVRSLPKPLSGYLDDRICVLVATLEGRVGFTRLAQVRDEAYNARIVAVLGAIERQVAALAPTTDQGQAEADFLERYRRQVRRQHGFLTPPDFDRRRRVAASDIYVPTAISQADTERTRPTAGSELESLNVWDLRGRIDRTVLLGDPGGGKTTAANVLTDYYATEAGQRVPFLVTLREYARATPIEWSVAEYVEQNLRTLYQSSAPDGLVERLLLTGRALVIFDGLDELLDTSRRREVSDRVEQFCEAYPLTPVLVTSRMVGYDQARLDDTQFTGYRLGGFGEDQVAEYAGKWFAAQEDMPAVEARAKAKAFLAESASITDLRANPLLLSLMCILYRGAGSLPADRAGIYAKCAELLLRKWDEHRDLYRKLDADHLVEPTLRYLAWWLFTRGEIQTTATERELTAKTTEFLHGRGYETEDEARSAAREFVEFCRGRMWVFSDAGTTADGEKLYAFTHRTFLEYFAARHLTVTTDTPEDLARVLTDRVGWSSAWDTVGELALKLKGDTADRGVDRVYSVMLNGPISSVAPVPFLIHCLDGTRPSPAIARLLANRAMAEASEDSVNIAPIISLCGTTYQHELITDTLTTRISEMVAAGNSDRVAALRIVAETLLVFRGLPSGEWVRGQASRYADEIRAESVEDKSLRHMALHAGTITPQQVLAMPDGFSTLASGNFYPASETLVTARIVELCNDADPDELAAIGRHVIDHPDLPWVQCGNSPDAGVSYHFNEGDRKFDEVTGLGMAASAAICSELVRGYRWDLTTLPMPEKFRPLFAEWREGRISLVDFV
jgi:NACHT domain